MKVFKKEEVRWADLEYDGSEQEWQVMEDVDGSEEKSHSRVRLTAIANRPFPTLETFREKRQKKKKEKELKKASLVQAKEKERQQKESRDDHSLVARGGRKDFSDELSVFMNLDDVISEKKVDRLLRLLTRVKVGVDNQGIMEQIDDAYTVVSELLSVQGTVSITRNSYYRNVYPQLAELLEEFDSCVVMEAFEGDREALY